MKVNAFHTDTDLPKYRRVERYVFHNQSDCHYGQEVKRDGNAVVGEGFDPAGNPRQLCDRCKELAEA